MIRVESNSGVVTLINPATITKVIHQGETIEIHLWGANRSDFRCDERDFDNFLCADRFNKLWVDLQG